MELRTVNLTRYISPLREGGSLPALAEAEDNFLYVVKFRGAGQGYKALIAELIGGELARAIGLKVPELVFVNLDEAFGRTEGDEEIQDLLKSSTGLNLALHFLSGSISFDPALDKPDALLASKIVWLDSVLMNMDRTARNTNMLMWNHELWLIDHGASLYFHHSGNRWEDKAIQPFTLIKQHVLLPFASKIEEADSECRNKISDGFIDEVVALIPEQWLQADLIYDSVDQQRLAYANYLKTRISTPDILIKEVKSAKG